MQEGLAPLIVLFRKRAGKCNRVYTVVAEHYSFGRACCSACIYNYCCVITIVVSFKSGCRVVLRNKLSKLNEIMIDFFLGDVITFGAYEQDNNLDNGAESIEWIVLEREGNKVLVISKYCLEQMPFNNTLAPVTWENCTVRKWLNNDFFNTAFSADEKTSILMSNISYPDDVDHEEPARTTKDRIFLLSENEALMYFDSDSERAARTTEYVGALHCYWILRTNGSVSNVAHVDTSGHVGYYENVDREWYIRPAMWIEVGN